MGKRDNFTESTKRALRDRVGNLCSRPECRKHTSSPNPNSSERVDITGRAAHITGAVQNSPRFDRNLSSEERRHADNGIWLCADCADLVDKNEGRGFTVEQLRGWKRTAEEAQSNAARLRVRVRRPTYLDNLGTPDYVNVPRLLHLAGSNALSPSILASIASGFPKDRMIVRELVEVENALRNLTIQAIELRELTDPSSQVKEGLAVSYHQHCRTKNGCSSDPADVTNYSFDRSPLIYLDRNGYRFIQPYDPRWVTTRTAQAALRAGSRIMAGIAIVKEIDCDSRQVIATPLAFGIPQMPDIDWPY